MPINPCLLSRVLLSFKGEGGDVKDISRNLSAIAFSSDDYLWLGADEGTKLERLRYQGPTHHGPQTFAQHERFDLAEIFELPQPEVDDKGQRKELDIEGLCYVEPYLWIVGSHSWKRKKPKRKDGRNPKRLRELDDEPNRLFLGRVPLDLSDRNNPRPVKQWGDYRSACLLAKQKDGVWLNALVEDLQKDPYFKDFVRENDWIPSKDNGLDIEGIAVKGDRIFLGLRGPVLRGWAAMLELEVEEINDGFLQLKKFNNTDECQEFMYKRHFLELNGLGIRDLCFQGEDLILLAGATMAMFGSMRLYRLQRPEQLKGNELIYVAVPTAETDHPAVGSPLELMFDLPFNAVADNAEGMTAYNWLGAQDSLMVVYDSPDPNRFLKPDDVNNIYADVFRLGD